jgi:hypothetical protein
MNFSIIYQLRTKKFWWLDVIFYFVISLLIATIICYFIFSIKIYFQNKKIKDLEAAMATIGTEQQKVYEEKIFDFQKKINDFAILLGEHKISSNVFSFIEQYTLSNVWFNKFNMNEEGLEVNLSGEAETTEALSRQISILEENQYIKKINLLNSGTGEGGKINFNLTLLLEPQIFTLFQKPSPLTP